MQTNKSVLVAYDERRIEAEFVLYHILNALVLIPSGLEKGCAIGVIYQIKNVGKQKEC